MASAKLGEVPAEVEEHINNHVADAGWLGMVGSKQLARGVREFAADANAAFGNISSVR